MKLAVVAANGKAGRLIVQEAVDRGLDVTAIVRGENKTVAPSSIQKDLFDLTKEDIKDFDVIIDAFGTWAEDSLEQHTTSIQHLADLVEGTDKRLLIVGGAGSLYLIQNMIWHFINQKVSQMLSNHWQQLCLIH